MKLNDNLFLIIFILVILLLIFGLFAFLRKRRSKQTTENQQIYIGNLPYRSNERDLRQQFSCYGQITDIRIVKDRRTGRSKGYGFITFSNAQEAKKSLTEHGKVLSGRSLVVHIAKPR